MNHLYDIHCHLIPEVDDGARSIEDSLSALHAEYKEGIRQIICTPHVAGDDNEETYAARVRQFEKLQEALKKTEIGGEMKLYLGCELYYSDSIPELLTSGQGYTMAGSRYVLTEFTPGTEYKTLYYGIRKLTARGYLPILAHIERYHCLLGQEKRISELEEMGTYYQVNAYTIHGSMFQESVRFIRKLLKQGRIHLIGTDSHGMQYRPPRMSEAVRWIEKHCGTEEARRVLQENPEAMIHNRII